MRHKYFKEGGLAVMGLKDIGKKLGDIAFRAAVSGCSCGGECGWCGGCGKPANPRIIESKVKT